MAETPPAFAVIQQISQVPGSTVAGFFYPVRALGLLVRQPSLWRFVLVPMLLNLGLGAVLYAGLLPLGWRAIDHWTAQLPTVTAQWLTTLPDWATTVLAWLPPTLNVLEAVLQWVFALIFFILLGLLLVQFGAILGAPWYGLLAEKIEHLQLGELPLVKASLGRAMTDVWRAITFQVKKLLLAVLVGTLLVLLNFIPIPGFASAVSGLGGIALAALLMGLDFVDPPLERRRLSFRSKLVVLARSLPASGTFSWVCLILVSIPLLNLVFVPICVAAGTLFCCDRVLPGLTTTEAAPTT